MTNVASDVRLHPWNRDFRWETPTGPFDVLTTDQAGQFDRDGCVVVEDVFNADEIAAVVAVTDRAEARTDAFLRGQEDGRLSVAEAGSITFTAHLVAESAQAREFASHRTLAGIAADLLGPDINLYWDQAVYKKPEKPRRFPWHQDNGYAFVEPQQYLTCWVALTDATVDNGSPQVVPGLHHLGTLHHEYVDPLGFECFSDPPGVVAAPVKAGGVVVFSSLTPHLTGPNTTDQVRKAYILQYAPAGAHALSGVPEGPTTSRTPCNHPDRQFPVVRGGRRLAPPPSAATASS
jgi:phytanoyl-CoA hydroxylase